MLIDNYSEFLEKIFGKLSRMGIDTSACVLDHIGYQASSDNDYDDLKPQFSKIGDLVIENLVNYRRLSIYRLHTPLVFNGASIPAVELFAPKIDQVCPSALQHAEFVITGELSDFVKQYPALNWDVSVIDQPRFPLVKLDLQDNTEVRFHLHPILDIIADEQKS